MKQNQDFALVVFALTIFPCLPLPGNWKKVSVSSDGSAD